MVSFRPPTQQWGGLSSLTIRFLLQKIKKASGIVDYLDISPTLQEAVPRKTCSYSVKPEPPLYSYCVPVHRCVEERQSACKLAAAIIDLKVEQPSNSSDNQLSKYSSVIAWFDFKPFV